MRVLTASQMAEADRQTVRDRSVPSLTLMEAAGRESVEALLDALDTDAAELRILVVCGKGNNGGDGLVMARLLHSLGANVLCVLLWPEEQLSADARENLIAFRGVGGGVRLADSFEAFHQASGSMESWDVVVDAIFGTGLTRAVEGWRGDLLETIGDSPGFVLSVDLPSGLAADDPRVPGPAVTAI